MPGRKPKPTQLRLLEGNREHRPIPDIIKVKPAKPAAPRFLDDIGKKEWKKRVPELYRLGLLTILDIPAFETYCSLYSEYKNETNTLNDKLKIAKEMRLYLAEFGMTPSSRSKVNANPEEAEADAFETLWKKAEHE